MAKKKSSRQKSSNAVVWLIIAGVGGVMLILFCVVGMALLLPAVQQARNAARRAQANQGNVPPAGGPNQPAPPAAPAGSETGSMPPVAGPTRAVLNPTAEKEAQYHTAMQNLRQLGLACHNFHDVNNHFPPMSSAEKPTPGEVQQSWLTDLLPYMDQRTLYASIKRNASWTDASQGNAFQTVVPAYLNPAAPFTHNDAGYALSHFAANSRVMSDAKHLHFRDIKDGTSQTMLAGTVTDGYRAWGDPANHRDGATGFGGGPAAFGAPHDGVALVLLADGSVKRVKNTVPLAVCQKLANPDDGEPLDLDLELPP